MSIERVEVLNRDVAEKAVRDVKWADRIGVGLFVMASLVQLVNVSAEVKLAAIVGFLGVVTIIARIKSGRESDAMQQYSGIEQDV